MLNNYYYRSVISQWIWELFEICLYELGYVSYNLRIGHDKKVYVECEGSKRFTQANLQGITFVTGLKLFLPESNPSLKETDLVNYSNYFSKTNKSIIIIDDPYFVISNEDKNKKSETSLDLYEDPSLFVTEHFKMLSKRSNLHAKHERTFTDKILLNLFTKYNDVISLLQSCLYTNQASTIVYKLQELKDKFTITITIPDRFMAALRQSNHYKYIDLSKIRFLLGLHNIDIVSTLSKDDDPIMSYNITLPTDNEAIDTMCEVTESNVELVKSSLIDFDISFIFKDELHKKLFANKDYFNQL